MLFHREFECLSADGRIFLIQTSGFRDRATPITTLPRYFDSIPRRRVCPPRHGQYLVLRQRS